MTKSQIAEIWATMTSEQQLAVANGLVDILYERPVDNNPKLVGFNRDQLETAGLLFGIAKKAVSDNGRYEVEKDSI